MPDGGTDTGDPEVGGRAATAQDDELSAWREIRRDIASSVRAFLDSFRARDLARAQIAYLAFELTEWGGLVALFVYAFQDGGMKMVGLMALLQQFPAAVVASFGSVLGDRFDRRRVLILVYAALTAATLAAGVRRRRVGDAREDDAGRTPGARGGTADRVQRR